MKCKECTLQNDNSSFISAPSNTPPLPHTDTLSPVKMNKPEANNKVRGLFLLVEMNKNLRNYDLWLLKICSYKFADPNTCL